MDNTISDTNICKWCALSRSCQWRCVLPTASHQIAISVQPLITARKDLGIGAFPPKLGKGLVNMTCAQLPPECGWWIMNQRNPTEHYAVKHTYPSSQTIRFDHREPSGPDWETEDPPLRMGGQR